MPAKAPRRSAISWEVTARATALHAAGTPWREICRRTGMTEWQWKRVRQIYNATLAEASAQSVPRRRSD